MESVMASKSEGNQPAYLQLRIASRASSRIFLLHHKRLILNAGRARSCSVVGWGKARLQGLPVPHESAWTLRQPCERYGTPPVSRLD